MRCGGFRGGVSFRGPGLGGSVSSRSGSSCRAHIPDGSSPQTAAFIFTGTGCLLSILLRRKTDSYETLVAVYRKTRDDDTEIKLLLQEKNQSLLEKQDYEIYAATLNERNRIAREIHDNVGHMLTRSILMVGALKTVNKNDTLSVPLCQLDETLNLAMNSIRESVHDLHDRSINLEGSLRTLADDFTFCPVSLQYDMSADVPADIKYCFIAVVKEALVNISRHSNASAARILAQEHPAFYRLSVSDNGTGNSKTDAYGAGGIGLINMQSRVASLKERCRFSGIAASAFLLRFQKTSHKGISTK